MRLKNILIPITLLLQTAPSYAKYEAHEWGTFTSVVDSTGVTQNGMYHEDEVLPDFVHPFGELRKEIPPIKPKPPADPNPPCHSKVCFGLDELQQNIITQKMETPVIYFYTDQNQTLELVVKFPEGIITETYPGPVKTFPTMNDPHVIGNGESKFLLNILNMKTGAIPFVDPGNIYGHARQVNSNLISSGSEQEKFLFYRGLGRFQPKISITSENGSLKLTNLAVFRPQAAFLVHVNENGHGQLLNLNLVKTKNEVLIHSKKIMQLKDHTTNSTLIVKGEQARGLIVDELVTSGLYKDEAVAMINTWENGYLKAPGLRLLYILPRAEVDEILPITLNPAPEILIRSFVGRMEILLDTEEQKILEQVTIEQDRFKPASLGRFAEPILHRLRTMAAKTHGETSALVNLIDARIKDVAVEFRAKATVK